MAEARQPFDPDPDGQPPLPPGIRAGQGLAYGPHRLQAFDIYAPDDAREAPVLVFWHGGGWANGYRQWCRFMAPHATALGLVLVTPSYRLVPEPPLPGLLDDALALLAHLPRELPAWGGSARRVLLSGHSAGGHIAAMAPLLACQPAPVALHEMPDLDHFQTHTQLRDGSCGWYQRLAGMAPRHTG